MTVTRADDLLGRIDSALTDLRVAVVSRRRLAVVGSVASAVDVGAVNHLCDEARSELDVTVCLVTLIGGEHQSFLGAAGIDPVTAAVGTATVDSLCQYVVATGAALDVDDTAMFAAATPGMATMDAASLRSYYGEPIAVQGETVGSFCALDAQPRSWSDTDRQVVRRWADQAAAHLADALKGDDR